RIATAEVSRSGSRTRRTDSRPSRTRPGARVRRRECRAGPSQAERRFLKSPSIASGRCAEVAAKRPDEMTLVVEAGVERDCREGCVAGGNRAARPGQALGAHELTETRADAASERSCDM